MASSRPKRGNGTPAPVEEDATPASDAVRALLQEDRWAVAPNCGSRAAPACR